MIYLQLTELVGILKASELKEYLDELIQSKGDMDVQVMTIYSDEYLDLKDPKIVYDGFTPKLRLG